MSDTAIAAEAALTNINLKEEIERLEAEAEAADEENESLSLMVETMGKTIADIEGQFNELANTNAELRRLVTKQFEMHAATIEQLGECLGQPGLAAAGKGQASAALMAASLGCTVQWLPEEDE